MINIIYLENCPFCAKAVRILETYNLKYKKILIPRSEKENAKKLYKIKSFPNIVIRKTQNKKKISLELGGCDDLEKYINTIHYIKNEGLKTDVLCSLVKLIK